MVEHEGGKAFKPLALVGSWRKSDLPQRQADGSIYYPYHANKVMTGEVYSPGVANLWESGEMTLRRGITNPTGMDEVSLTLPEPTVEEEAEYAAGRALAAVRKVVDDYTLTSQERLAKVRDLLG